MIFVHIAYHVVHVLVVLKGIHILEVTAHENEDFFVPVAILSSFKYFEHFLSLFLTIEECGILIDKESIRAVCIKIKSIRALISIPKGMSKNVDVFTSS